MPIVSDVETIAVEQDPAEHQRRPKVFVHLAQNKDAVAWRSAKVAGSLVGRNDETPYGYGRASTMGCDISFSRSQHETVLRKIERFVWRAVLGFDLAHSKRQRAAMMASDIVWTHTESQFLAVAAVIGSHPDRPRIVGQAVWLFDRWPHLPFFQRWLFRRLMRHIDVLTTLSPLNAEVARKLFPATRVEVVSFGIPSETMIKPQLRAGPARVVAVGNDRHRDWSVLVKAVAKVEGAYLDILSGSAPQSLVGRHCNMRIYAAKTNTELEAAYANASVAVIPLLENLHASGATVIQEAVLSGVPVIASDTGGLRNYFTDDEVTYVPVGDAAAMAAAIIALTSDPQAANAQAERAQRAMLQRGMGAEDYIRRHVALTKELLVERSS